MLFFCLIFTFTLRLLRRRLSSHSVQPARLKPRPPQCLVWTSAVLYLVSTLLLSTTCVHVLRHGLISFHHRAVAPLLTCSRLSLCSRRKAARRISRRRRVSMTLPPASVLFRSVASLTASPLVRDSSCLISSFNLPKLSPSSLRNSPLIRFVSLHLCTGCSGSAAFMFVVTAPYACHATTVLWHPC